jgi:16S rRNA (adenine1518-N6/adenine1519-N6)-dimethyltransferase
MSGGRPKRSLGQNFLIDQNLQRKIVAALEPQPGDIVIEIGPGRGALTRHIAPLVQRLIAIEKDDALAADLAREFVHAANVTIVHGDALEVDTAAWSGGDTYKLIGNIPYNITTPLLFHWLAQPHRPALLVLMVQREVADRILALPGVKEYGALSVGVRTAAAVERMFHVPRTAFRPQPAVDSSVIRITPHEPPRLTKPEEDDVRVLTRTAFAWRRKQLQKILRAAPPYALAEEAAVALLHRLGVAPQDRPEALAPEKFVMLARALREHGLPRGPATGSIPP